jgi:chromosome partitioning protein
MARGNRLVIAIGNVKGGTSKTTTAVFLAHALREKGRRVVLVDADPQASAVEWSALAPNGFPFPVMPRPTRTLYAELDDFLPPGIDTVVIDTPPVDERGGIVLAAARAASVVVAPVAPSPIEYTRLHRMAALVTEASEYRSDRPVPLAVLLSRTVAGTVSYRVWREQAEDDGYWCLKSEVRFLQQFAQAYGQSLVNVGYTAYGDVAEELLAMEGVR